MKHIFKIIGLAIAITFTSLSAQAQSLDFKPYFGAGFGLFSLDSGAGSENAFGGFGTIGADLHKNLAIEVRIGSSDDAQRTGLPAAIDTRMDWFVSYHAKLQVPVTNKFRIYGLAGGTSLKATKSQSGVSESATNTGFSYGGGAEFRIVDHTYIGAEWFQFASDKDANAPAFPGIDARGVSGTLRYEF